MEPLLVYLTYAFIVNCYITHGLDLVSLWTDFDSLGVDVAFRNYNADKLVAVFVISPSAMHRQIWGMVRTKFRDP